MREQRIARSLVRKIMSGNSPKEQKVRAVVDEAQQIRGVLDRAHKDLLSVGRKVKYIDGVGQAALEAIWAIQEADLRTKEVVDSGKRYLGA